MKIRVREEKPEELKKILDDVNILEKHEIVFDMDKPYKGKKKKQEIFMAMVSQIDHDEFINWDNSFRVGFTNIKTLREASIYLVSELNKCFKATEKAYEKLR